MTISIAFILLLSCSVVTPPNLLLLFGGVTEVVLTKDNLARRNWGASKQCSFCVREGSIQHLFFDCLYATFL
jgi:hypothetical protein